MPTFQSLSPTGEALELEMSTGLSARTLVPLINRTYGLSLKGDDFINTNVYQGQDKHLRLDMFNNDTGSLEWIFKHRNRASIESQLDFIPNPKEIPYPKVSKHYTKVLNSTVELSFLINIPVNKPIDAGYCDTPRILANLLNNYNIGGWNFDSYSERTTDNFILRYIGETYNVPPIYNVFPNSIFTAVIELKEVDQYQTYILAVV